MAKNNTPKNKQKSDIKMSTRIVAIVMIVAVVVTFSIMTGLFLFD